MSNLTKKSILLASSLLLVSSFSGCSDDDSNKESKTISTNTTPKIEIVQNKDSHAIKVNKKEDKAAKNDTFYYDYGNEHSNKIVNGERDKISTRTVLDANMNIRSPYERVQISLLTKQLSPSYRLKCSACHDDYANGVIGPSLLGKDTNYIYNKIQDFKTGKKSNPLMDDLIHLMSDKDIKNIANEIYNFNKAIQKIRNK